MPHLDKILKKNCPKCKTKDQASSNELLDTTKHVNNTHLNVIEELKNDSTKPVIEELKINHDILKIFEELTTHIKNINATVLTTNDENQLNQFNMSKFFKKTLDSTTLSLTSKLQSSIQDVINVISKNQLSFDLINTLILNVKSLIEVDIKNVIDKISQTNKLVSDSSMDNTVIINNGIKNITSLISVVETKIIDYVKSVYDGILQSIANSNTSILTNMNTLSTISTNILDSIQDFASTTNQSIHNLELSQTTIKDIITTTQHNIEHKIGDATESIENQIKDTFITSSENLTESNQLMSTTIVNSQHIIVQSINDYVNTQIENSRTIILTKLEDFFLKYDQTDIIQSITVSKQNIEMFVLQIKSDIIKSILDSIHNEHNLIEKHIEQHIEKHIEQHIEHIISQYLDNYVSDKITDSQSIINNHTSSLITASDTNVIKSVSDVSKSIAIFLNNVIKTSESNVHKKITDTTTNLYEFIATNHTKLTDIINKLLHKHLNNHDNKDESDELHSIIDHLTPKLLTPIQNYITTLTDIIVKKHLQLDEVIHQSKLDILNDINQSKLDILNDINQSKLNILDDIHQSKLDIVNKLDSNASNIDIKNEIESLKSYITTSNQQLITSLKYLRHTNTESSTHCHTESNERYVFENQQDQLINFNTKLNQISFPIKDNFFHHSDRYMIHLHLVYSMFDYNYPVIKILLNDTLLTIYSNNIVVTQPRQFTYIDMYCIANIANTDKLTITSELNNLSSILENNKMIVSTRSFLHFTKIFDRWGNI